MPLDGSEFKFEIDETTKLLIAARERIERGWCQKTFRLRGEVCVLGAIEPKDTHEAHVRFGRAIGADISIAKADLFPIVQWNDTKGRTKEEVLAAFDCAIASV